MQVPGVFETGGGAGASRGSIGDAALNGRLRTGVLGPLSRQTPSLSLASGRPATFP